MTRIGIIGAAGRMGQAIATLAAEMDITVSGGFDRDGQVSGDYADLPSLAAAVDVLIDFSSPGALATNLDAAGMANVPMVIGTTGLDAAHHTAIDAAAQRIPILQTANTSLGVNVLAALIEQAAAKLGPDWDIEILEMHHRHKVDAPSGTALLLGAAANKGRGTNSHRTDRMEGGARAEGDIYYASLRGGSVAGDHHVIFAAEGERIEIGHRAESRAIFARGALKAAGWLMGKPAGRYTMADMLAL